MAQAPTAPRASAWEINLPRAVEAWTVPQGVMATVVASFGVYAVLFATGMFLYGRLGPALAGTLVAVTATVYIVRVWPRVRGEDTLEPRAALG